MWGLDPSSHTFISVLLLKFPRLLYHHHLPFYQAVPIGVETAVGSPVGKMNSTSRPCALIPTEQISYPPWPSLSLPSRSLVGSLNQALFHLPPGAALLEMPQRLSTSCRSQRSMSWSQLTSPLSTLHLAPVFLSHWTLPSWSPVWASPPLLDS